MAIHKVSQPSSPLRHATEMCHLIKTHFSNFGASSGNPILVVVSDGDIM